MTSNTKPSQTLLSPPSKPLDEEMVWIPGGTFQMGSNSRKYPEERPIHTVTGLNEQRYVRPEVAQQSGTLRKFPG
ncbi:SUMF1/EgtB/PvdO family nonheme iron enzyme [Nodularia sp. NIES-3585]|uniref:SUMF1/EgtB/PvdO family nonheme iron enzyme n=1 Tax=Nodularia sp. NIES-3585 TaxID=1973477 RepID=UPI000B5CF87F|nr:SUMF1/EgtB/PvdO family nonheme iron enzyme [Nodularia sp. NIES-3585]GAX37473.1 hypothetical protein NIES3585_35160 [Nodularia sp. NIES-3585]